MAKEHQEGERERERDCDGDGERRLQHVVRSSLREEFEVLQDRLFKCLRSELAQCSHVAGQHGPVSAAAQLKTWPREAWGSRSNDELAAGPRQGLERLESVRSVASAASSAIARNAAPGSPNREAKQDVAKLHSGEAMATSTTEFSRRNFMPIRSYRGAEQKAWIAEVMDVGMGVARNVSGRVVNASSSAFDTGVRTAGQLVQGPVKHASGLLKIVPQSSGPSDAQSGGDPPLGNNESFTSAVEKGMGLVESESADVRVEQESPLQQRARQLVRSTRFEAFSVVMILLSAIHVGAQIDYQTRNLQLHPPPVFRALEIIFLVLFVLEVCVRLFAYRSLYFSRWGWVWNVLDLVLIFMQFVDEIIYAILISNGSTGAFIPSSAGVLLRIVRVLRAVRVVRIFQLLRFAEELRLLVACIMHSLRAFHWAMALLMMLVYVVGTQCTQLVLLSKLGQDYTPDEDDEQMERWFGSVPRAVLSLFQGLTGGIDWNDLVEPLMQRISPVIGFIFSAVQAFFILAVLNVITATFVQAAITRAGQVQEMQQISRASQLFRKLDSDRSGVITLSEIEDHLETEEVKEFFRSIDVDVTEAKWLFAMLDHDRSGAIELHEFLIGCLRLQGPARAIDLVMVMREWRDSLPKPQSPP